MNETAFSVCRVFIEGKTACTVS